MAWEVLVIDNNSTDQTRDLVEDFSRRHSGRFRYLLEPRPGKSYALNSGIANAFGRILAFVDDDAIVHPRWLQNLTAELGSGEWAGTAGRVLPAQTFVLPPWLSRSDCVVRRRGGMFQWDPLAVLCAQFDLGDHPIGLDLNRAPYGVNMAFPKNVFEKYGGFRLDLGPRPNSQLRNEDVEFGRRLMKAGEQLRYVPSAVVYHPVPKGRVKKGFFLTWWFDYGRASILERGDRPDVWGIPHDYLSLIRRLIAISIMSLRWMFATRPHKRFFFKCMVWQETGMVVELYRRLAGRKASQATTLCRDRSLP